MKNIEVWKDIKGYEGKYQVSSFGRVKGLQRKIWQPGKNIYRNKRETILKQSLCGPKRKYYKVNIYNAGQQYTLLVHQLVLETFVGECPEGLECCHNNGISTDNRLENLRWDTRSNNYKDKVKHGTAPDLKGEKHPRNKYSKESIIKVKKMLKDGGLTHKEIAKRTNVSKTVVSNVSAGNIWQHLKI